MAVELEGFVRSVNGHGNGANGGNGLLQGMFASLADVDEALVLSTSTSGIVVALLILLMFTVIIWVQVF